MKTGLRRMRQAAVACLLFALVGAVGAQNVINTLPIRVYGSSKVSPITSVSPNYVEGREFFQPQGIAIDPASGYVYVSDTRNHRVLGFTDFLAFQNGAPAALVVGQSDFDSTLSGGPPSRPDGLSFPTGLALDAAGRLYVADTGNNRILRFPKPSDNWPGIGSRLLPDMVIGQTTLNSNTANAGGRSASTLDFPPTNQVQSATNPATVGLTFDTNGNLWVTDWDNHRVLRYPADKLGAGAANGPAADLVLGQPDFTTRTAPATNTLAARQNKATLSAPRGVAYLSTGNLLAVADSMGRVLVYENPASNGQAAVRVLGVPTQAQLNAGTIAAQNVLNATFGVFAASDQNIGVVDTFNNRILIYPPRNGWVAEATQFSPGAETVIGQGSFTDRERNRNSGVPGPDGFYRPMSALVVQGKLYVVDTQNHRVLRHTLSGTPLSASSAEAVLGQFSFQGSAPNLVEGREVNFPSGIAFDYNSDPPRVYIADTGNHRILGYRSITRLRTLEKADIVLGQPDLTTTVANYPGGDPDQPTQRGLNLPWGVTVDADGNVWVADAGNSRVVRFPKPDFDNPQSAPEANLVLGQLNFTSKNTAATQATMNYPNDVRISTSNSVVVSDRVHHRVLVFQGALSNGMAATKTIGQPTFVDAASGNGPNQFNSPRGIAIDKFNRLYVADFNNNRVQIFDDVDGLQNTGANVATSLTKSLGTNLTLNRPEYITVDRNTGDFWVTELSRARVLRYPEFLRLQLNNLEPDYAISSVSGAGVAPISVALDPLGFPLVGENGSRIAFYFPRLATTNAATFFTSVPELPGPGQAPVGHLAPNTIASAFSFSGNFDSVTDIPDAQAAQVPLPTELSDIEVTLDGRPLPLFFVSKSQINFYLPNNVPQSGVVVIDVRRKSTGDILAGDFFGMAAVSPGLFTRSQDGIGQIAAVNYNGQNPSGANSAANPVAHGQVIALYGTGMGFVPGAPDDGSAVNTALSTPDLPQVGGAFNFVPPGNVEYSGFAPGFVGLWQINVRIPDNVPTGDAVPIVVLLRSVGSSRGARNGQLVRLPTTIAVRKP